MHVDATHDHHEIWRLIAIAIGRASEEVYKLYITYMNVHIHIGTLANYASIILNII